MRWTTQFISFDCVWLFVLRTDMSFITDGEGAKHFPSWYAILIEFLNAVVFFTMLSMCGPGSFLTDSGLAGTSVWAAWGTGIPYYTVHSIITSHAPFSVDKRFSTLSRQTTVDLSSSHMFWLSFGIFKIFKIIWDAYITFRIFQVCKTIIVVHICNGQLKICGPFICEQQSLFCKL
jgi:hypothetical protein